MPKPALKQPFPKRATQKQAARKPFAPSSIEAMAAVALAHLAAERTDEALASLANLPPPFASTAGQVNLIGRIYLLAGAAQKALDWFDGALLSDPAFAEAMINRARALAALGEVSKAILGFKAAFAKGWHDPVAYYDCANLLRGQGRLPDAIAFYDKALHLRQAYPEALRAGGTVLRELGNVDAALAFFDEALRLAPTYVDAALDRGNLLLDQRRLEEALATYDSVLARLPGNALLLTNRGVALHEMGRLAEARDSLDAAIAANPGLPQAHLNRGNVLSRMGLYAQALPSIEQAIALQPFYPAAHSTRGLLLKMLTRFDESAAALETALAQQPGSTYALANRGELRLLLGALEEGWPDYENRFLTHWQPYANVAPDWTGEPRPGARIAVFADQGAGDYINFVRFVPLVVAANLDVTFVCRAKMQRIFRAVTKTIRVVEAVPDGETFDCQLMLSSAPFVFKTSLTTIPTPSSYLEAEPDLIRTWASRLGPAGFKIGLCWRGSQDWRADRNRSIPLELLEPLARIPGVRLISLQLPDNTGAEDETLRTMGIEPLGAELDRGGDAFLDTAAVMANLDLIITCDTSIAHLAGALGCPTFVLLQAVPEWRWLMDRETSPWYESVLLFRQRRIYEWDEPVQRLVEAVRSRIEA